MPAHKVAPPSARLWRALLAFLALALLSVPAPASADVAPPAAFAAGAPGSWPLLGLALSLALSLLAAGFAGVRSERRRLASCPSIGGPYRVSGRRPAKRSPALLEYAARREAALSAARRRRPISAAVLPALGALLLTLGLGACSSAATREAVVDIGAIAGALPGACVVVNAADGSAAGQVCGSAASAVQGAAAILQGILSSLSPATSKAPTAGPFVVAPPVVWLLGSGKAAVTVTIRADLALQVVEAAKAKRKGGAS